MNATELAELTIKELKAIAIAKGIEVAGDKRSKATWVLALESALTQTPKPSAEIIEPSPTPEKVLNSKSAIKSDSIASLPPALEPNTQVLKPNPQVSEQTVPSQQRGASTVALIVVLAFGVAFLVIKTGFTSISWAIAALMPLALGLWRYLLPDPRVEKSIDYFPSAIA
jgi:hypothetical protein